MTDTISYFQHRIFEKYGFVPSPSAVRLALKLAYKLEKAANPDTAQVYKHLPK